MNATHQYLIPSNTSILWRNRDRDLKLKPHVTEGSLRFDEILCTGNGGLTYYFELGDWLIVVDAELVVQNTPIAQQLDQTPWPRAGRCTIAESAFRFHRIGSPDAELANLPLLRIIRE